jgi:hypothetical protein
VSKIARALSVGFFRHPSRVFAQARRSGCPWFWIICGECFFFLQKDEELGGGHGSSTTYIPIVSHYHHHQQQQQQLGY